MIKNILFLHLLCLLPIISQAEDYTDEAITYPLAFAQVREDPFQDQEVINRYFPDGDVSLLMIASGGDTAAYLLGATPISNVTIVDPNPAQIYLTQLKLHLLYLPSEKRLALLGHAPMEPQERKEILVSLMRLLDIPEDAFGDLDRIAEQGLDQSGKYERVFAALRENLNPYHKELEELFLLNEPKEQAHRIAPNTPFGRALDRAFDSVMSQKNLVKVFGDKATANRIQDFSRHFAERTRGYLDRNLASESPFFAQMFLGKFHQDNVYPWHSLPMIKSGGEVEYFHGMMHEFLKTSEAEKYDMIHLSNILDWLGPEEAQETLSLAFRALKPDGAVVIRQLNSNLDIPAIGTQFRWNLEVAHDLNDKDRSFFYQKFHLGFKPHRSTAPQAIQMADAVLKEIPILEGDFFVTLKSGEMSLEQFQKTQEQFFYAVDYFSRPMAALVSRLPTHVERRDILHNIVEEHGDFDSDHYHSNTFKQFLQSIGYDPTGIEKRVSGPQVMAFNTVLGGVAVNEDPLVAVACLGIIEYAFADISAEIGRAVLGNGWVREDDLVHYDLHAELDKRHSEEFFNIVEPHLHNPQDRAKVFAGMSLGAYTFNRLYEDLYALKKEE